MIRPRRVVQTVAFPVLVFFAAWLAAWLSDYAGMVLPHGVEFDLWLTNHPIFQSLDNELEFGVYAFLAAVSVAAMTYVLFRFTERRHRWWQTHLHLACLLYAVAILAVIGYTSCLDSCEGLMLGMFRAWGYAAIGGAIGNAILVRRLSLHEHTA